MAAPTKDNESWMSKLPPFLQTWDLMNIAIPGSHNSFTFDMTDCSPVCKSSLEPFLQSICDFGFVQTIIFNWSVTQTLNVWEQLLCGIRYFDIRMARKMDSEDLNCVHGLFCDRVIYYLNEIKKFLVSHPKEIVILDFNHFYDMSDNDHVRLCSSVKELFGNMLIPDNTKTTIENLWAKNYQVIFIYAQYVQEYADITWSKHTIRSKWPDKSSVSEVIEAMNTEWNQPLGQLKFRVFQGILTPSTNFVLLRLGSTLKASLLQIGMCSKFVQWIEERCAILNKQTVAQRTQTNIFLADFVEQNDFADNVISLNYTGCTRPCLF